MQKKILKGKQRPEFELLQNILRKYSIEVTQYFKNYSNSLSVAIHASNFKPKYLTIVVNY